MQWESVFFLSTNKNVNKCQQKTPVDMDDFRKAWNLAKLLEIVSVAVFSFTEDTRERFSLERTE